MKKTVINTDKAPQAIGPYSQAIKANGFIFVSGQIPLDYKTGEFVEGKIAEQTKQCLENLKEILAQAGVDFSAVVKTGVFLADMNDFAAVNEVYAQYFSKECPARACVEVSKLPKGALVEIELIAIAE